ncbi:hypothetical protein AAEX28_14805 [Lentisphaerota bacterium WC36G]|nr:hypothetical protein LJT99_01560 [Lentisphaerae bacterium WC36]
MPESIVPFEIKPNQAITAEQLKHFKMIITQWNKSEMDLLSLKRLFIHNLEEFCEEFKIANDSRIKVVFQLKRKDNFLNIEFIVVGSGKHAPHKNFVISSEQLAVEGDFYYYEDDGSEEHIANDIFVDDDLVFDNTFVEQNVKNFNLLLDGVLNYRLRMMDLNEIEALSNLYKKYEFNCRVNHFKDKKLCRKKMENGTLQVVVAEDVDSAVIIGAIGILHTHHCRIPEITAGYVNIAFRSNDIFYDLTTSAMQFIRNECPNGVQTYTFMTNKLTQQAAAEEQLKCSAILFTPGAHDPAMSYRILKEVKKRKNLAIPRMLRFCPLTKMPLHVYAPKDYHQIIREIYHHLGLRVTVNDNQQQVDILQIPEHGSLTFSKSILEYTEIFVQKIGRNTFSEIVEVIKEEFTKKTPMIILHCSLDDKNGEWFGTQLVELGFAFSGILPWGAHGQEQITYQLLRKIDLDREHCYFLDSFDKKLYNFICDDIEKRNKNCPLIH